MLPDNMEMVLWRKCFTVKISGGRLYVHLTLTHENGLSSLCLSVNTATAGQRNIYINRCFTENFNNVSQVLNISNQHAVHKTGSPFSKRRELLWRTGACGMRSSSVVVGSGTTYCSRPHRVALLLLSNSVSMNKYGRQVRQKRNVHHGCIF